MGLVIKLLLGLVCFLLFVAALEQLVNLAFENASSIDACLDGGGAWDYDTEDCKYR
ncbi:MAG: hypothetical protein HRU04_24105 [Oceanospirillaceae bacterium]|nr:hypothetical protein [Oceanospirillaceae bacterium]